MKTTRVGLIVIMLAIIGSAQMGFGADNIYVRQPTTYEGPDFVPGQIIVQFRRGVPEDVIAQINEKNRAKVAYTSRFARFKVLSFPEAVPPQAMVNIYAKNPNVEYAELNYVAHAFDAPSDPLYSPSQWHLDNPVNGGIQMEEAWPLSTGAGVTVAVVDTGVKLGGPDGVPASGGYDFVNRDSNPDDDNGHGTHVAGTIAQNTNNGVGVAGVAYGCSIMPVKVLNKRGSGTYSAIAEGIRFAANNGAKIINMSLGGSYPSSTLESAVRDAYTAGVTIVCASGNGGTSTVSYPAAYNAYCIAVGATRYDEAVAYYSNGGSALDLTAPGGDVTVDQNGDGYGDGVRQETFSGSTWGYYFYQGTSMASPHVAGVAALLISQGTYTTPSEVKSRLESTAKDKGPTGWDTWYGWGIVDAYAALSGGAPANQPPIASFTYSTTDLTCNVNASASSDPDGTITSYAWNFGDGATATGVTASHAYAEAGAYTVLLTVTDDDGGTDSTSQTVTVTASVGNQPPTASFTYTTTDLTCSVDASASSDPDGMITSYVWDFGDTTTGTGVTASHTYSAAGTYTVTLTVTDDDAAEGTTSQQITATLSADGGVLHVKFTDHWTEIRPAGKNTFVTAFAGVEVSDGDGKLVEGATVMGEWSLASSGIATGVTNVDGLTVLTSPEAKAPRKGGGLTFRLTIINVEKSGYTYDPASTPPLEILWP